MSGCNHRQDAFSAFHPAVNFAFFLFAIGFAVVIQHPAYLLAGALSSGTYYLLLHGTKGWKTIGWLLPMFLILTAVNPLLNTRGERLLCYVFGRPYTLEALLYGGAIAGVLVVMMLWFGCYNAVLTGDKFTSLFGSLAPSLALLLVMVLRMVPNLIRKAKQIISARKCVGKGSGAQAGGGEKLRNGMTVLSALTDWALEGSVVTGDSMRARGYGTAKRTSFQLYCMTAADWGLFGGIILLSGITIALGGMEAVYTPRLAIAPLGGGFWTYCLFLCIPTALHCKEAIQWHILRSRI